MRTVTRDQRRADRLTTILRKAQRRAKYAPVTA